MRGMHNNSDDDALFEIADDVEPVVVQAPAGRSKVFRSYDPGQSFLMPPSLDDWLPQDHTVRFIVETVELLDLSVVYDSYVSVSGAPPYDPEMMLKLLFYGYSTGVTSCREMERRCHIDVAFRWLTANSAPDYRSIARFRRRHLQALDDLFTQVLVLCGEAGLVKLGRVALDGTKLRASAYRDKAMNYSRLGPRIEHLEAEVAAMLAEAEATDLAEDEEFGEDKSGDEVPPELARLETRIVKMRAAKKRSKPTPQTRQHRQLGTRPGSRATTLLWLKPQQQPPQGRRPQVRRSVVLQVLRPG
jgi:transposase